MPIRVATGYVTKSRMILQMGKLRFPRKILRVHIEVLEAFDSSGGDNIAVGNSSSGDAYAVSVDVSTTGIKAVTLGADVGFDGDEQSLVATYSPGGTNPTVGKALVAVEILELPPSP